MSKIKELEKEIEMWKEKYNKVWLERYQEGLKLGREDFKADMLKEIKEEIYIAFQRGYKQGSEKILRLWEQSRA